MIIPNFNDFVKAYQRILNCKTERRSLLKQLNNYHFSYIRKDNLADNSLLDYEKVYELVDKDPDSNITSLLNNPQRKLEMKYPLVKIKRSKKPQPVEEDIPVLIDSPISENPKSCIV